MFIGIVIYVIGVIFATLLFESKNNFDCVKPDFEKIAQWPVIIIKETIKEIYGKIN